MKPSLLKRHCDKKDRDESYFQRLGEYVKWQRLDKIGTIYQRKKGIFKSLYEFALLVAKSTKAHTTWESLTMLAANILVSHFIGKEEGVRQESVSLSNNTIKIE